MRKSASIVVVILAVLSFCFTVSACGVGYSALVVDEGIEFTAEFLKSSITYGAWCENESYDPEKDDYDKIGWYDSISPKTRTYIVKEQSEADKIFAQAPSFDFENEIVLVYCRTETNNRKAILKSVTVDENGVAKIEFTLKKPKIGVGDASMPQTRILVVKMNKLEISSAEFTQI